MRVKDYLSQFQRIEKISKGMSEDEKYRVEKDGVEYLLRVSKGEEYAIKKREYEYLRHLNRAELPVPRCIALVKSNDGTKVYSLLSWVKGEEAETVLPNASDDVQYEYGVQAGKILRAIHDNSEEIDCSGNWYDRYYEIIEPRLEAFRREGEAFEGSKHILRFIEENRNLLKTRPMCHHHGDYHMGNLIVDEGKLWVIDWHTVDFDNIGDPWYEFNRIGIEHPMFARGQIDGYFGDDVPTEFWKLFALYFSTSAITSIVWAKYWAPNQFDYVMGLNQQVLQMFDDMENPIPRWYRGD